MNFNKKNKAFTLAETLIVLGIIGIVATLTIPTLSNDTNSKETVTRLKKTQAMVEEAFARAEAQGGHADDWSSFDKKSVTQRVTSNLKVSKTCSFDDTDTGCFSPSSKYMSTDGTIENDISSSDVGKVVLVDGTSLGFYIPDGAACDVSVVADDNTSLMALRRVCGVMTIDIDGPNKGKNLWGKDMFAFYITKSGFFPVGFDGDQNVNFTDNCISVLSAETQADATGCTAWVVSNSNMDYLQAKSDGSCLKNNTSATLAWDAQGSCY